MNASIDEKKAEALARMKQLDIFDQTIKQFENEGKISLSEPPFGAFYWIEGEELQRIRDFEAQFNALVYVAIRSYASIGMMDSYLYVSDYPEEWASDRELLKHGETIAYVYNHDMPDCSEAGGIGIAPTVAGGLRRTW